MATDLENMLMAAAAVRKRAHAPYSNYRVGAVILADNGSLYAGCNVENAAYPLGACAEANAIGLMVAAGETEIKEILVMGPKGEPATPCGGCRQRLLEFGGGDIVVHVADPDGIVMTTTLGELLPSAFGAKNLS